MACTPLLSDNAESFPAHATPVRIRVYEDHRAPGPPLRRKRPVCKDVSKFDNHVRMNKEREERQKEGRTCDGGGACAQHLGARRSEHTSDPPNTSADTTPWRTEVCLLLLCQSPVRSFGAFPEDSTILWILCTGTEAYGRVVNLVGRGFCHKLLWNQGSSPTAVTREHGEEAKRRGERRRRRRRRGKESVEDRSGQ